MHLAEKEENLVLLGRRALLKILRVLVHQYWYTTLTQ